MFDLDGTLIDSKEAIVGSAVRTLETLNVLGLTEDEIRKSIGLPIEAVFGQVMSGNQLVAASKAFREDLLFHGIHKTNVYPEVENFLKGISGKGIIKAIVTNKPKDLAVNILSELDLLHHFEEVVGPDIALEPKPSPAMIHFVRRRYTDCSRAFMIGDRRQDIDSARAAGVKSVLMIHPDHESSISAGSKPDYTSHGFKDLEAILWFGETND